MRLYWCRRWNTRVDEMTAMKSRRPLKDGALVRLRRDGTIAATGNVIGSFGYVVKATSAAELKKGAADSRERGYPGYAP